MRADRLATFVTPLLRAGQADLSRYEQPYRGVTGRAAAVATPKTVDELRALINEAFTHRVRLLPQGANTGLVGASVPPPFTESERRGQQDGQNEQDGQEIIVVSMEKLLLDAPTSGREVSSNFEIFADEGVALVSSGARLSDVNTAAAKHGLHLPVDLSADPMIGGMIATNTGGSRVLRYGPMKQHVMSVQAVAADSQASIIGGLSRLRKDSRGLDTSQLLIGSGGTLGIITSAVLSLSVLSTFIQTWWLAVDDPAVISALFSFLHRQRPGVLSAFEFVSDEALSRTLALDGAPRNPFGDEMPRGVALVEWSGTRIEELSGIEDDVARAASEGLLVEGVRTDSASAWGIRHRVSESLRHYGIVLGHDISVPLNRLMVARAEAIEAVRKIAPHAVVCDFGHVGDGGLHLNLLLSADDTNLDELRVSLRAAIDAVVARHGGSYSAEHGLGPLNAERWKISTPTIEQQLIRAFKFVVDPRNIMGHPNHPYNRLESLS